MKSDTGWFFRKKKSSFIQYGPGITLYFKLLKWLGLFYFIFSLSYYLPFHFFENDILFYFDIFTIFTFLFLIVTLRYSEKKEVLQVGSDTVSSEDYAIYIDEIPDMTTSADLKQHFEKVLGIKNSVHQVQLVERNKHIQKMLEKRANVIRLLEKIQLIQYVPEKKTQLLTRFQKQKELIEENIRKARMSPTQDAPAVRAFVIFECSSYCDKILEMYGHGSFWKYITQRYELRLFGRYCLKVFRAPPPSTVLWKNLNVHSQIQRQIITWIASIILIVLSFLLIVSAKSTALEAIDENKSIFLQNIDSITVVSVNFIFTQIVEFFAYFERHHSLNKQSWSISQRLFLIQFINTSIVVLVMEKFYNLQDTISTIQFSMIFNILTPHLPILLKYLIHKFKDTSGMTDREIQESKQGPEFELSFRFSSIFATMFTVMMYSTKIPILYPIMFCTLFVRYWIDKYLFTNYYSIPPWYSIQLQQSFTIKMSIAAMIHLIQSYYTFQNFSIVYLILIGILSFVIIFHFFTGFLCSRLVSCITCGFCYQQEYEKPMDASFKIKFTDANIPTYSMLELDSYKKLFAINNHQSLTEISHLV